MPDEPSDLFVTGTIALEHLTGPSRGTVTWLSGQELAISLSANRLLHVTESIPEEPVDEPLVLLRYVDGTYEITALEGEVIWVNGSRITHHRLEHCDMIEFGDIGPLSRFKLYRKDRPGRKMVGDILNDGFMYLRVSRKPLGIRLANTCFALLRRLAQETTMLFRLGVVIVLVAFATMAYQQNRLNALLQGQIENSSSRMDSFASALSRSAAEALAPGDLVELQQEFELRLSANADRLAELEHRSEANARVIADSTPSVIFLQASYGFQESSSGRFMRYAVDRNGQPLVSPLGQPLLTLVGEGPIAERQLTGTGFFVGDRPALITNKHVALPWEEDANVQIMASRGLEPVMINFIAYRPGRDTPFTIELMKESETRDLAILRPVDVIMDVTGLALADEAPALGNEVIVMGYPTGLRSMLAQSGEGFIKELRELDDIEFWSVAARLAKNGYIAPLSSRGIVSQATTSTIVYDAETTHGGSGGPVLDINGKVVAVNTSILPEYGGSNLGIPVADVKALLAEAGLN